MTDYRHRRTGEGVYRIDITLYRRAVSIRSFNSPSDASPRFFFDIRIARPTRNPTNMVKTYVAQWLYTFPWSQVVSGFWQKFPNPYTYASPAACLEFTFYLSLTSYQRTRPSRGHLLSNDHRRSSPDHQAYLGQDE